MQISSELKVRITPAYRQAMRQVLMERFFKGWDEDYLASDTFTTDMEAHLTGRMLEFERYLIPWVSEVFNLEGSHIVEIGCGTGSSTIPFALRAGRLDTFDILENSLEAARQRAIMMQVENVHFHLLSGDWAKSETTASQAFVRGGLSSPDVILMIALLEHLTIAERLNVLTGAFKALKPGGIIVIYETPNRFSYFDWHTYLLPFIDWLPDDLARQYAMKTSRTSVLGAIESTLEASNDGLYRLGRGASFHEFDLALPLGKWRVLNDGYSPHLRGVRPPPNLLFYQSLWQIRNIHTPSMPLGFLYPSLDLIIQKAGEEDTPIQRDETALFQEWLAGAAQDGTPALPLAEQHPTPAAVYQIDSVEQANSRLVRLALRLQSSRMYKALQGMYRRLRQR